MSSTSFKNDMTMMFVMHDALRRELDRIARVTARRDDDPGHILRTAVGWQMFKNNLHVHHTAEDVALWPPMQQVLADRPEDLALLDAMEAEHAAIDPLIDAIDAALADRESGPSRVGELTDALATSLRGHLAHEEADALALIDATLTEQQFQQFGMEHTKRIGPGMAQYMPWLLDSASPERTAAVLAILPPPVREAYQNEWQPAYAKLDLWAANGN